MFEESSAARFDEWAGQARTGLETLAGTTESAEWTGRICAAARLANRAAAAQLVAIGELFAHRYSRSAQAQDWVVDAVDAVAAEVAAALRISQPRARGRVQDARALRERLPKVGQVFQLGDIDVEAFRTIVSRTDLIQDPDILAVVDGRIAANVTRWPSMTRGRLAAKVDAIVVRVDVDAVRRRKKMRSDREVWIGGDIDGIAQIQGSLLSPDAHALDARLTALAGTVCPHDPRTTIQRRADALGALAAGADRLGCRCRRADCAAGARKPASPVTIHVIAELVTVDGTGTGTASASELDADGLIDPELLIELAQTAKLVPLLHPGDAPPEPGYVPSAALAAFVRARDLTCRWPGCDHPALRCDLDHTVPFADGGKTHAANLKCYCRTHHLVKTFWGWTDQQLSDGTVILTSPSGQTYVTTPGSALLFPGVCRAVGGMAASEADLAPADPCSGRTAMMPRRRRTRADERALRIAAERRQHREARMKARAAARPDPGEPPPF
ncbi:DUF222 domain-containing protein [Mycobacterium sp. pR1184]|uniref:HNH endonuclease signature motif containing protein n=1 Tax=Mycobacterium sp. pR1184 TaxID=3238981 RepID=UPI00351B6002